MGDQLEATEESPLSRVDEVQPTSPNVFGDEYMLAGDTDCRLVEPEGKSDLSEEARRELQKVIEMIKAEYPLQSVIASSGVRLRRGGNRHAVANCPFPRHLLRSPTLKIDLTAPNAFRCDACGVSGDVIDYIGALHGVVFLAGQVEVLTGRSLLSQLPSEYAFEIERAAMVGRREEIERTITPDSVAADVYQALLDRLPLFDCHYDYLLQCGLSAQDCEVNGYRSLPSDIAARVGIAENIRASGYSLESVCGFFRIPDDAPDRDMRGRWCVGGDCWGRRSISDNASPRADVYQIGGILVPVRDRKGRVVRLVTENDPPPTGAPVSLKNVWPLAPSFLTSAGRTGGAGGGASGGARVHYAGTAGCNEGHANALWLTESPLYADVLSSQLCTSVIGVLCYAQLVDEIIREASLYKEFCVTIDNQNMRHAERICNEAIAKNIWTSVAEWDFVKTRGFSNVRTGGGGLQWMASYESWLNENI